VEAGHPIRPRAGAAPGEHTGKENRVRISKPLIGTAAGAAVLGATMALGLSMASASTSATSARSPVSR
jgi:hypothetical protein